MKILKLLRPEQILKIEDVFKRFPHISESVFNELDNQSLINCKETSKELSAFLDKERFLWIRVLRNYSKHYQTFKDSWKWLSTEHRSKL